jgi:hypothetical protein
MAAGGMFATDVSMMGAPTFCQEDLPHTCQRDEPDPRLRQPRLAVRRRPARGLGAGPRARQAVHHAVPGCDEASFDETLRLSLAEAAAVRTDLTVTGAPALPACAPAGTCWAPQN